MRNYVQPGDILPFTAPVALSAGDGVQIGQLFVVALGDAAISTEFQGATGGVFTLPKATGQSWTVGALIYWNDTECTTAGSGLLLIGVATAAAGTSDTTGNVRLNGVARPDEA